MTIPRVAQVLLIPLMLAGCEELFVEKLEEDIEPTPVRVATSLRVAEVQSGGNHTCARTTNDQVWCWGSNEHGALGSATSETCVGFPCSRDPLRVMSSQTFTQLAATQSGSRSCGLTQTGEPWCWGYLAGEQDGSGVLVTTQTPRRAPGSRTFARLVINDLLNCGLVDSQLWCWGSNDFGNGTSSQNSAEPLRIADSLPIADVAIGWVHRCLLTTDGRIACWGSNWYSAFGFEIPGGDPATRYNSPVLMPTELRFTQLIAGSSYTCALTAMGQTYCWGALSASGASNGGQTPPRLLAGAPTFTRLYGGPEHACGLTASGELHCWGSNLVGELGDGSTADRSTPARVKIAAAIIQVSANPVCAVTVDANLYCWGSNLTGQLAR